MNGPRACFVAANYHLPPARPHSSQEGPISCARPLLGLGTERERELSHLPQMMPAKQHRAGCILLFARAQKCDRPCFMSGTT